MMAACVEAPRVVMYNCGCFERVKRDGKSARACPHGKKGILDENGWKVEYYDMLSRKTITVR